MPRLLLARATSVLALAAGRRTRRAGGDLAAAG